MKTYKFTIRTIFNNDIEIQATNYEKALAKANEDYTNGELELEEPTTIVVDNGNFDVLTKKERFIQKWSRKIAAYIYARVVTETESGAMCVYQDEIENDFGFKLNEELRNSIKDELYDYEGVSDIELYQDGKEWVFDVNLYTDYCQADVEEG